MKRSPELAALSRDHRQALEVALRLRRATLAWAEAGLDRITLHECRHTTNPADRLDAYLRVCDA